MKIDQKTCLRLKNIIKHDKEDLSPTLVSLIKSDVFDVLSKYINLTVNDVSVSYFVGEDGLYHFDLKVDAKSIKRMNFLSFF